ncbi:MAG: EAL domain-containing protein [Lachnospiraceae bacterium]|nr:EAL domain-containing protein [Lachnospiraceae bacterium]
MDGSKFAIVTETQSIDELKTTYENVRMRFREGLEISGTFVTPELSAGIMELADFDTDDQTVYACLNFAYEESKTLKHGNIVEFHEDDTTDDRSRIARIHVIRNSISKNFEGFSLLYQPVVNAASEKMIGAEALLRWQSKEYGIVPPDFFIPVLERDPLFPDLGEWILRRAVKDAGRVLRLIPDFVINVNLSYTQIEQPDFTDRVWNVLNLTGFPPDHLCLEVTERCRLLDMELLKNVMTKLHAGGVRIALDDFETGFSSVGVVKNLPFDTIKIDRSFVQRIEEDEKERRLVSSFAELAGTYGAKVCVEGIETSGMRDILKEYGIHSFQGYYYSRPIEIEKLLKGIKSDTIFAPNL